MQLILIGVNYRSAPLHAREQLSFHSREAQHILHELQAQPDIAETVLLSTCNRTEIYALVHNTLQARVGILDVLSRHSALSSDTLEPLLYTFYNKFAATHLFEVASGLDSMVLGENEILRQVKTAQDMSQQEKTCGPILNQLLRFAITAGKRVRTETDINKGCASIGALAARLVRERFASIKSPRLLIMGAGQMAQVMVKNLDHSGAHLTLANRTRENSDALRAMYPGDSRCVDLESASDYFEKVDALVVCTSADHYLLKAEDFKHRRTEPLLLIDLSVPRNVDPALGRRENIQLHDVDTLQHKVDMSIEKRRMYIVEAQSIIGEETTRFLEWFNNRDVVPTIKALYETFESIREREIERGTAKYKADLSPQAEVVIERVTRAMVQKILHHPVVRLKNATPHQQQAYHEALNALFALNTQDEIDKYVHHEPQTSRVEQNENSGRLHNQQKSCPFHEEEKIAAAEVSS